MPNSMTNLEINDVLSSIRRLVSGDKSAMKKPAGPDNDRFVLTPAHRVIDETAHAGDLPELFPSSDRLAEKLAPFELVNPAFPTPDKSASEPSVEDLRPWSPAKEVNPYAWMEDISDSSAVTTLPAEDAPASEPAEASSSLEDRIAELEEAVGRSEDEWEPDGSEPDTVQLPVRHLFEVVDNSSSRNAEAPDQPEDEIEDLQFTSNRDPEARKMPLQLADVAKFTHVPAKSLNPKPVADSDTKIATAAPEVLQDDDDVFVDEDVLRRVVSEIVREELQGKLGERLTRNVRKMVRREIEQTLSLKNFD